MDGLDTITWEEFVLSAEEFARLSESLSDLWRFTGDKTLPGQAYLTRQEKTFVPINYPIDELSTETEDKLDSEPEDDEWDQKLYANSDPFEISSAKERPLVTEHHILWSMSYSVPVIYFNGWKSDFPGINPVRAEVAQRLLRNDRLAYGELSQAIHPILGKPCLHLHPCGSRELMMHTRESANRLVSWLSFVAPAALNLRMRPEYFRLTFKQRGGEDEKKEE